MVDDNLMDQNDIEQLLNQAKDEIGASPDASPPSSGGAADSAAGGATDQGGLGQSEIESLLGQGGGGEQPASVAAPSQAAEPAASGPVDDDKLLGQDDIEKLLGQAQTADSDQPATLAAVPQPQSSPLIEESGIAQDDVECLLNQAELALASVDAADTGNLPDGVRTFPFDELTGAPASTENATLDLIREVELDLKIELGRTHMYLEDVLKLRKGSVVPLDKLAGDPVDIYVNGRLIARGEVLVLNDNFCVRVAELLAGVSASA